MPIVVTHKLIRRKVDQNIIVTQDTEKLYQLPEQVTYKGKTLIYNTHTELYQNKSNDFCISPEEWLEYKLHNHKNKKNNEKKSY